MKKILAQFCYLTVISLTFLSTDFSQAADPVAMETLHISNGKVDFFAVGRPSMLKVHGVGKALEGTLNKKLSEISGHFSMKMNDFSSGLGLRDSHTKEKVFEVEKYPTAELTFKPTNVKPGEKTKIPAILKFHGVEKEVQCETTINVAGDKVTFESTFPMQLTDFSIQPPEFAGMKINNDVRVEVSGEATK